MDLYRKIESNEASLHGSAAHRPCGDIHAPSGNTMELERFFSLSRNIFCVIKADGQLLHSNKAWHQLLGYDPSDSRDFTIFDFVVPADHALISAAILSMDDETDVKGVVSRIVCFDGSRRHIEWDAQRSGDYIYTSGYDVTSLLNPAHRMNSSTFPADLSGVMGSEKYLRTVLETTQDAFVAIKNNKIIDANDAFFQMSGYDKADLEWIRIFDILTDAATESLNTTFDRLLKNGSDIFESRNKRKDGSVLNVEVSTALISRDPMITVCFIRDITERKKAEKSLLHFHELLRYIIEHNRIAVAVHDKNLDTMYVSRPYIKLFKLEGKEIIGKNHYEVLSGMPESYKEIHRRVLSGEVVRNYGTPSVFNNDTFVLWECRPWYEEDGSIGGFILYIEDITVTKRIEQMLTNEKEQFRATLLSVGDGVIATDNQGTVTVMNPVAEKLTGYEFARAQGNNLMDVLQIINAQTGIADDDYVKQVLDAKRVIEYSNRFIISSAGTVIPVEISIAPIRNSSGDVDGAVIIIRDFTEKKAKQEEIEYLSYNDALTGLYNRRYMEEAMRRLDTPDNLPLALLAIDVNGLKLTNDAFGHEMGDQLLKTVAGILKNVCKENGIIGRMGGDEFYILLTQSNERQAIALKQSILDEVSQLKLEPVVVSLAIGYAVKVNPTQDIKETLTASDNSMYQDKIKFGKIMRSQTIQLALQSINLNYEQEQIHTERVSRYCQGIGKALNFTEKEVNDITTAGGLHDIGKIMVPSHVLNKPGKLTNEEFDLIKRHPEIGYQMLKLVDEYVRLSEYVLHHHERWDGSGYPVGLKGDNIPLFSRIIAVADAFEAMTALRPYQTTKSKEEAVRELLRCAGRQFDPEIVRVFIEKVL